jgi:hypothetical protein
MNSSPGASRGTAPLLIGHFLKIYYIMIVRLLATGLLKALNNDTISPEIFSG